MLTTDDVMEALAEAEAATFYFSTQNTDNKTAAEVHTEIRAALEKFWAMTKLEGKEA